MSFCLINLPQTDTLKSLGQLVLVQQRSTATTGNHIFYFSSSSNITLFLLLLFFLYHWNIITDALMHKLDEVKPFYIQSIGQQSIIFYRIFMFCM